MARDNPLWGAPRIHGELLKLGIEIGETSVSKYLVRRRKPPSQTWRTFLENHVETLVSVDFFIVPTMIQGPVCLCVLAHDRRRISTSPSPLIPPPSGPLSNSGKPFPGTPRPAICCATAIGSSGRVLEQSRSHGDPQVRTAPRSPWQSPYVERLIGTIRRECLDHVVVLNETHLTASCASTSSTTTGPAHTSPWRRTLRSHDR